MDSTNLYHMDQSQMNDLQMGQQRLGYSHSENIHFRGTTISQPNISALVTHSVNLDAHYILDAHDNVMVHRMTQYIGLNPSSSTAASLNHRATSDQLSGSSTSAVSGTNGWKNAKGRRGNHRHFDASASSSMPSPNARHTENGIPLLPERNLRSRLGESVMVHDHNHLIRGNHLGQHFQPAAPSWLDHQSLPMPYVQAPNANASVVLRRRSLGTAGSRSGLRFCHPPPVNPQLRSFQHQPQPVQEMRGHPISFQPPITAASHRVPTNHSHSASMPIQNAFEMGPRHVELVPSAGPRIYRSHRGNMHGPTLRHRNLPRMTFIQVDDATLLVDHHRDMRLDIEDMSYEELLALGERIGNVKTGLSEEMINNQMKTKIYELPTNLEQGTSEETETDCCIICQDEYKNTEKIGILRCGHEYHAGCLMKWLLEKNVCPICKAEGLTPGE